MPGGPGINQGFEALLRVLARKYQVLKLSESYKCWN